MPGQGETILAVDDDKALLPAIVDLLTMIGYRMITPKTVRRRLRHIAVIVRMRF